VFFVLRVFPVGGPFTAGEPLALPVLRLKKPSATIVVELIHATATRSAAWGLLAAHHR